MPRVDYLNNSNGSLLIEPQRTNLETKSNGFSTWSANTNVTRTANYTLSPDGTQNATRLQFTANGSCSNITQSLGSYTISCYAKRNDSGTQSVGFFTNGSGVVNSAWSLTSDWKRFSYTFPALNAGAMGIAGNSGADVSVFGCQLEGLASYATSYIPTSGSTVTRVAETCSQTPASGVIGQTEGVLFAEFSVFDIVSNIKAISLVKSSSPTSNAVILYYFGNRIAFDILNPSGTVSVITNITNALQLNKVALKYKSGDIALWFNGVEIVTRTNTISLSGLDKLEFDFTTGNGFYGKIKQLQVYKTALTDTQLATLTTI